MARAYVSIFMDLVGNKDLSLSDKAVLTVIIFYCNLKSGICSASISSISKKACVSQATVKTSLKKLEKYKMITKKGKSNDDKRTNLFTVNDNLRVKLSAQLKPKEELKNYSQNLATSSNRYETEVIVTNTPTPETEKQVVRKEALVEQLIPKKSESKYDHFKYNKNLTAEEKESIDTNYSYWPVRIAEQIPRVFELPTTIQKEIRSDIIETQRNINEIVEYLKKKVDAFVKPFDPGW